MSEFTLILLLVLNAGISFWNAKEAGKIWAEAQAVGGWIKLVTWCTAIQSALGFSYIYIYILSILSFKMGVLSYSTMSAVYDLSFFAIILPLAGTGFIMTIESWIQAKRELSLLSLGVAGWNTFASIYNAYHVIQAFGPAYDGVKDFFSNLFSEDSDDDNDRFNILVLVMVALLVGIITTMVIIQRYAGTLPIPESVRQHGVALAGK